jgi:hypothetical protein
MLLSARATFRNILHWADQVDLVQCSAYFASPGHVAPPVQLVQFRPAIFLVWTCLPIASHAQLPRPNFWTITTLRFPSLQLFMCLFKRHNLWINSAGFPILASLISLLFKKPSAIAYVRITLLQRGIKALKLLLVLPFSLYCGSNFNFASLLHMLCSNTSPSDNWRMSIKFCASKHSWQ